MVKAGLLDNPASAILYFNARMIAIQFGSQNRG